MSPITRMTILGALLLIGSLVVIGCGSSSENSSVAFDPDTEAHPVGWLPAGHMASAETNIKACAECHGEDFSGGISKVNCTSCHLGGPESVHPTAWTADFTLHAPYVQTNGNESCKNEFCHGPFLTGVTNSGPSCANYVNNSSCHQKIP